MQEEFDAQLHPYGWAEPGFQPTADWLPAMVLGGSPNRPAASNSYYESMLDISGDLPGAELRPRSIPLLREENIAVQRRAESCWLEWRRTPQEYFECRAPEAFRAQREPCARPAGWGPLLDHGIGFNFDCFHHHLLAPICRAFGDDAHAQAASALSQRIQTAAVRRFWSADHALFVNNLPWLTEEPGIRLCDRSLATAILFDFRAQGQLGDRELSLSLPENCRAELVVPSNEKIDLPRLDAPTPPGHARYQLPSGTTTRLQLRKT